MQNFTLHTHNNELRFDGRATAEEMIAAAESRGFKTIGVSNHMIMHHELGEFSHLDPMHFTDYQKAEEAYKRHIEILENLKSAFKIEIKIGFEVDFFAGKEWRNAFEKMRKNLNVDYLIGSNHFLRNEDESFLCNIYHLKHLSPQPDAETLKRLTRNHFKSIVSGIRSGYFTFMAHLDYCTIFGLGEGAEYDDCKYEIMEALEETKTPIELNTSGYNRIGRPHPAPEMLVVLAKDGRVPVLISDDAHDPQALGQHFEQAEELLKSLGYTNRFRL